MKAMIRIGSPHSLQRVQSFHSGQMRSQKSCSQDNTKCGQRPQLTADLDKQVQLDRRDDGEGEEELEQHRDGLVGEFGGLPDYSGDDAKPQEGKGKVDFSVDFV